MCKRIKVCSLCKKNLDTQEKRTIKTVKGFTEWKEDWLGMEVPNEYYEKNKYVICEDCFDKIEEYILSLRRGDIS